MIASKTINTSGAKALSLSLTIIPGMKIYPSKPFSVEDMTKKVGPSPLVGSLPDPTALRKNISASLFVVLSSASNSSIRLSWIYKHATISLNVLPSIIKQVLQSTCISKNILVWSMKSLEEPNVMTPSRKCALLQKDPTAP
ncbi:MAG: hypothetical protein JRI79_15350 [Deltaproteobacteria bacterium]|nr:hypothetical protein [Deltaproteobacteria bacterium]MBW1979321.1 hypothetical protein [Deltaproteobacteria bacterium]MBW2045971.1 hypothetical protein [Deltaproteobacteria bacterium]MBW2301967.1 hypothetical protein [Deltaproteobacteria bacterium]